MGKRKAIILVILAEVVIYLFLLVGWPMLVEYFYSCVTCTGGRELQAIPGSWLAYLVPGLVGALYIMLIIVKKREVKNEVSNSSG